MLTYPPEADEFRSTLRSWLEANLTDEFRSISDGRSLYDPVAVELHRRWQRMLFDAGHAGISWPKEFGGRGASLIEEVVFHEEAAAADAPGEFNPIGLNNVGPTIMAFGNDEQKAAYLPAILRGDDIWCQGFSEPDAGSDLAGLNTSAIRDGDDWVINGQKVWTTLAQFAAHCQLLARTDREAAKHRGLTCLVVPMNAPGVVVRPLRTISGEAEFSEIFLTDVRVPAGSLLGAENDGWAVAMTTLGFERGGTTKLYLSVSRRIDQAQALARRTASASFGWAADDPRIRERLARHRIRATALRRLAEESVSAAMAGEPPSAKASIGKIVWSDLEQELSETIAAIDPTASLGGEHATRRAATRGYSLAGGTTEINKNVLAQRVLGLPRE